MAQDKHKYYIKAWEKSSDNMEGKDPDYENTDSLSWEEAEKEQEKLRDKYQSVGIYAKKDDREVSITLAKGGKVHKVMKEFKEGKLKSGSGKKVTERKQAVAIALSEARKSGEKIPKKKDNGGKIEHEKKDVKMLEKIEEKIDQLEEKVEEKLQDIKEKIGEVKKSEIQEIAQLSQEAKRKEEGGEVETMVSDIVLKDEGDFFILNANTDTGREWIFESGRTENQSISEEDYQDVKSSAENAGLSVEIFAHGGKTYKEVLMKGGMLAPNQMVINDDAGNKWFQSYDSMIARIEPSGKVYLDEKTWDYSRTTLKYLNKFLGTSGKKEIEEKIANGEYIFTDLNFNKEKGGMYEKGGTYAKGGSVGYKHGFM